MADSGKRKRQDSNDSRIESRTATPGSQSESQQSVSTLKPEGEDPEPSEADEIFKSVLATLPPVHQWSRATIESLRSAVSEKHPKAEWQDESEWTRRVVNAILASNEGWNWQRLKTCSNADYFSLPNHTITLLNAIFYANCLDTVKASCEAHGFQRPLNADPGSRTSGRHGRIGYPIFRVDYSSDENFELYKTCWDQFMEKQFYIPKAVNREDMNWYWVDDKSNLDEKGPREVQELFHTLLDAAAFPNGSHYKGLWLCLMVDRGAIESMLRVYGPPATEIWVFGYLHNGRRKDVPFLPYVTAVDTSWTKDNNDEESSDEESQSDGSGSVSLGSEDTCSEASGSEEVDDEVQEEPSVDDGEFHGHLKCALQTILQLWQNEQIASANEYYPRDGRIWGGIEIAYEAPGSLH